MQFFIFHFLGKLAYLLKSRRILVYNKAEEVPVMDEKTNEIEKLKFHVFRDERFIDLNLYQFGWERTSPIHSYGPYARNHYLFHYAIAGRGVLLANGTEY